MELFSLFAKIGIDSKDFEDGVEDAADSGESLADQLQDSLSKAADTASDSMNDAGGSADNMSDGFTVAKGVIADLVSSGIQRAIDGFTNLVSTVWNLDDATEEFRQAMGRLNTAFETAGYGADAAWESYQGFYGILGDTDRATEASQLLAQLAENAEDVSTWTNIAAGVNGTFGDSLPVEGLIEAANETANVGTVTGVLADALNWVGISEDEFNTKLAECSTESERNQLIMSTLAAQYDSAADSFYRNNEALVASRDSQSQMQTVTANLGAAIGNIKTAVTSSFTPAITEAAAQATEFINNIDPQDVVSAIQGLISAFQTLLPVITGVTAATVAYKAAIAIAGIIDSVKNATQGMTIAQAALNAVMNANPFVLVATLIAGVGTALLTLYATNEEFRSGVQSAWNTITSTISGAVSTIVNFFTVTIPNAVQTAIDWFTSIPERMKEIGENIVEGIWDGISGAADWLYDKVSGFLDGIVDGAKEFLGIHSPSTVFADMGRNMALGLGEGWDSEYDRIRRNIENGMSFGTANVDFASSGLGMASSGMVNGISSAVSGMGDNAGPITINLMFPDGTKLASYLLPSLIRAADANGTPIAEGQRA